MFSLRRTLVLLLLLSSLEQVRLIARAPLAAQDAVEFVGVAQRIEADGLAATIRGEQVAPLFPATVYLTHAVLTGAGRLEPAEWGRAAQIAAAVPLVLAVIPIFLLARKVAGVDAALVASILFALLPATSRLGADGISDSLHLCLAAWALLGLIEACEATNRKVCVWGLASGACVGAALLCRVEALVLTPLIMLVASLRVPRPRTSRALVACVGLIGCFGCGCLTCLVPLVAAGVTEPLEIVARLQGGRPASTDRPLNGEAAVRVDDQTAVRLAYAGAQLELGRKDPARSIRVTDAASVGRLYVHEFLQACGYISLPLAAVGLWSLGKRITTGPWLLLVTFATIFLVLLFAAVLVLGYVTSRHFLLPVMALLPAAGLGLIAVAQWIQSRLAARTAAASSGAETITRRLAGAVAVGCVLATLLPPHHTHAAHRHAADWLRTSSSADALVLDQHGWTALSSGRPTYRFDEAEKALTDPRLRYVLVERIDLEADSRRGKSLRAVLGTAADAARCFADVRGRAPHDVLIFHRAPGDSWVRRRPDCDVRIESTSSLTDRSGPTHAR